ncbi:MAG TPA: hypothetical protein VGM58_10075, partial [Verrucomicrobiae bacterium]
FSKMKLLLKLFCHRQIADDFLTKAGLVPIQHGFENRSMSFFKPPKLSKKKRLTVSTSPNDCTYFGIKNFQSIRIKIYV